MLLAVPVMLLVLGLSLVMGIGRPETGPAEKVVLAAAVGALISLGVAILRLRARLSS